MLQFYIQILNISGLQIQTSASDPTLYYAGIKPHNLLLKIKWLSTNTTQHKIALKELLWSRIMSTVLGMGSADSPSTLCHDTMMQTKPSLT